MCRRNMEGACIEEKTQGAPPQKYNMQPYVRGWVGCTYVMYVRARSDLCCTVAALLFGEICPFSTAH